MKIADRFRKYFTNIGPNLARSIPNGNPCFRSHLCDNKSYVDGLLLIQRVLELIMVCLMEANLLTCSKQEIYKHILYIT